MRTALTLAALLGMSRGCASGLEPSSAGTAPATVARGVASERRVDRARRGFVHLRGNCLERDGARVRLVGSSAFHLQEEAARAAAGQSVAREHVAATFDAAVRAGVTVLRVAAFNDGVRDEAIQPTPGAHSERGLRGLDHVVAEAGRRGILLLLVLTNYWDEYGGVAQYLRWQGLPDRARHVAFQDPGVLRDMTRYVSTLPRRVNTVTGVAYADDPTILAWEVMNEPRGDGLADDGETMARFLGALGEAVRAAAPDQLVLAGDEGFDADTRGYDAEYWTRVVSSPLLGPRQHQSFRLMAQSPAFDAATLHFYPDWWGVRADAYGEAGARWIHEHARIAAEAGRAVFFDEFGALDRPSRGRGLEPAERRAAYAAWFAAARQEPNVVAVLPWGLSYEGRTSETDGFEWGGRRAAPDPLAELIQDWSRTFAAEPARGACP